MFNSIKKTIYLLVIGDRDVGKSLMVSQMIEDLPILHLLKDNHSTPTRYPIISKIGRQQEIELVLQECSTSEELNTIITKNIHFPRNIVLIFHCGSYTSFEHCQVFYRMLKDHSTRCKFLWIANTDCSIGGSSGWKERIALLVNEPNPRFVLTSLANPDLKLQDVIMSFFSDISESNQHAVHGHSLGDEISPYSSKSTLEVCTEVLDGPWINGVLTIERHTMWQPSEAGFIKAPGVRFWIDGSNDIESQKLPPVKSRALWSNRFLHTMKSKKDIVQTSIQASIARKILPGLENGKSNDEVKEIGDGILNMLPQKGYRAGKSTKGEGSSILYEKSIPDERSGWYTDDEEGAGVKWIAYWSTSVQWLRQLCFDCGGRR